LFYFGLVSILRWQLDWSVLWWWLGGGVGLLFSWADRLAHVYFTRPFEQLSLQVKSLVAAKRYREAVVLLDHRKHEQRHLTVRSALFLAVWVAAALFVITSTGSIFAVGMVMAIGLSVLVDMIMDFKDLAKLKWWLFWQIKRTFSDKETKGFVAGYAVVFGLLTLMII
jgi:hypothetical protein